MRIFSLLFMLSSLLQIHSGFTQKNNWVTLKGHLKNFNNQVQVEDMSEMKALLLPDPNLVFVPDSAGNFQVRFQLSAPNYFRLGRNILYLSPGDNLTINADQKDARLAVFKGTHSRENEYLRETPYPKAGSFLEAGRHIKSTLDSTVKAVLAEAAKRTVSLQQYAGSVCKEFLRLETARIRADILNSFAGIYTYFPYVRRLSKDSAEKFQADFAHAITPYRLPYEHNFLDSSLLKLVVYTDIAEGLVSRADEQDKNARKIRHWLVSAELADQLKAASDRTEKLAFRKKIEALPDPVYRRALEQTLERVLLLSNGDPAVDFTAMNTDNKQVTLSSLKGKLIYIDLWATWCGPCLQEMPALQKLKETYKDNDQVIFLSLSIDDDKTAWKNNLQQRKADGLQWVIDRNSLAAYNIIGVPRIILIDRNFHVADMNGPLPSSKQVRDRLQQLLSK